MRPRCCRHTWSNRPAVAVLLSSATGEVTAAAVPSQSPVCDWLLNDHLDDSLEVYTAEGTHLGSVGQYFTPATGTGATGSVAAWCNAVGSLDLTAPPDWVIGDRHLLAFVQVISAAPDAGYLLGLSALATPVPAMNHPSSPRRPVRRWH